VAPDNAALVDKAAGIIRNLGGVIATARHARRILKLRVRRSRSRKPAERPYSSRPSRRTTGLR
jgi:beta-keto acid cleavage enzyme